MSHSLTRWTGPLPADSVEAVRRLVEHASTHDAESPLSEAFLLALASGWSTHLLLESPLTGYAQVMPDGLAEMVVHPDHRQHGRGRALVAALRGTHAHALWAHGGLSAARAFAHSMGLPVLRELHVMSRPLRARDAVEPVLPEWVEVTSYAAHPDLAALTALNAAAFAHHPEQGVLTSDDLAERMSQPWFDPRGLILLTDRTAPAQGPIAFHWTKRERESGEVYVVGVHPAYQGRGLAKPLTLLGMAHLAQQGDREVHLYVDADNSPARRTYAALGFTIAHTDVLIPLQPS